MIITKQEMEQLRAAQALLKAITKRAAGAVKVERGSVDELAGVADEVAVSVGQILDDFIPAAVREIEEENDDGAEDWERDWREYDDHERAADVAAAFARLAWV